MAQFSLLIHVSKTGYRLHRVGKSISIRFYHIIFFPMIDELDSFIKAKA